MQTVSTKVNAVVTSDGFKKVGTNWYFSVLRAKRIAVIYNSFSLHLRISFLFYIIFSTQCYNTSTKHFSVMLSGIWRHKIQYFLVFKCWFRDRFGERRISNLRSLLWRAHILSTTPSVPSLYCQQEFRKLCYLTSVLYLCFFSIVCFRIILLFFVFLNCVFRTLLTERSVSELKKSKQISSILKYHSQQLHPIHGRIVVMKLTCEKSDINNAIYRAGANFLCKANTVLFCGKSNTVPYFFLTLAETRSLWFYADISVNFTSMWPSFA